MATPTQLPPSGSSLTSTSPPSSSTTGSNLVNPSTNLPSLSVCLYVFAIGVLVVRSVRRRRQRNTAFAAALASGSYGPLAALRGKQGAESQPVLWETLITSVYDPGKRWAGLLPVAGVGMMTVPVHETSQHPASRQPRRRFPALGTRRPVAPDLLQTAPSLESSALSSGSMHLTVLVTMPTPLAHGKVRQGRGPPVVELGIAEVTYMPTVS